PYVETIKIGPTAPCEGCSPNAICADRPIPVTLSGYLTNDCLSIREVLVQDLRFGPGPGPATAPAAVILRGGRGVCRSRGCIEYPIPWSETVEIRGLPPGPYQLPVRVEQLAVACDGSTTPDGFWTSSEPFSVTDSCAAPPPESCFVSSWDHGGRQG